MNTATTGVTFVELPLYPNTLPLASGYLQAYAQQDPAIAAAYRFTIVSQPAGTPVEDVLAALLAEEDTAVYALSCYLWNMRAMTRLLDGLLERRPDAYVILGGPQVMNHAAAYVPPGRDRVVVCNGEGEATFSAFLAALLAGKPDFAAVPGISFYDGDTLRTTEEAARLRDLDEIPSPFAAGIFDGGDYTFAVVETNRGCPFKCSYCYWGAATNDKVYRWDQDRVLDDLTWISEHGVESVFLADANWGALPRDVELTRHLVACKQRNGYPMMISMQAAKNRPDRVTEITELLVEGGLLASQPVSLQTMSDETLKIVERANIRESTYVTLQAKLKEKRISSYTELIWPLPGETLRSFRDGVDRLCRSGADAIVTYPQLLLHNTPMHAQQEVLGIRTVRVDDAVAEADVVVGTKWVDRADYDSGIWFTYAVISLYNGRAAQFTARELDRDGTCSYGDFLAGAAEFFRARAGDPICAFFADSVSGLRNYDINNTGKVLHYVLHSHRAELDRLLRDFLREHGWLDTARRQAAFELDLLARPYVYREPFAPPSLPLRQLEIKSTSRYAVELEASAEALDLLGAPSGVDRVRADHTGRRKMPYPRHRSLDHNAAYCQAMMNRLRDIMPSWSALAPDGRAEVFDAA
ncbi:B12-binding domain-containing radical SAM protein [Amycolatopsis sp. Poz14]|uniref:B12-binding domain-containing radical SAM protein n=1 Tax=Amycolatopsis sp. Poz14 TaxID=1447705 RepID=UPI001EE812D8|nr:radical SAM protein [Amycolatopsis sp. Poz14]MCG3754321.1 radical SAM protein [Amycolatopsis sp. Poz14]